jgi:D-alanyl-D-alanine carboxypeptidase/D-alanyl-D-alanine-endopeptidase (penicillin-binding protein 4)
VIDSVSETAPLDQVQWSVLATDARTGRTIYARQPGTKAIPGSNMKLPGVTAALHLLGPDYRFRTPVYGAGTLDRTTGVLSGDLVLVGTGDPTLAPRFHANVPPLRALVDSLLGAGVREVTGSLVIDASAWDSVLAVASWMVEDLPDAATGGAFALSEGATTVVVQAGARPGDLARVSWDPHGEDGFIVSRIRTAATAAEAAASPYRTTFEPESRRLILDGRVAAGDVDTLRVGTRDPVRQAGAALARALADAGVRVRSGWRVAWTPGERLQGGCVVGALDACGAMVLATLRSPPLMEIAAEILGPSNNWMAEQLVRALGQLDAPSAATARPLASWTTGLSVVRRYLVETIGVDSLDLRLRDGSGLSAQNVITPRALVQILAHARSQPWGEGFRSALAEPGEVRTTLAARLPGLQGRVWAKSGTLTNVATLSGYVLRPDGEVVIFAIMTNGSGLGASRVQPGIDRIVRALAGG